MNTTTMTTTIAKYNNYEYYNDEYNNYEWLQRHYEWLQRYYG